MFSSLKVKMFHESTLGEHQLLFSKRCVTGFLNTHYLRHFNKNTDGTISVIQYAGKLLTMACWLKTIRRACKQMCA